MTRGKAWLSTMPRGKARKTSVAGADPDIITTKLGSISAQRESLAAAPPTNTAVDVGDAAPIAAGVVDFNLQPGLQEARICDTGSKALRT